MNVGLLLLSWLTPLLLAPLMLRGNGRWWPVLAGLPALATALWLEEGSALQLPWLLLGMHLELDVVGRLFLLYSTAIWAAAAIYGVLRHGEESGRFWLFFLAAMAGNLLLVLAADALSFYLGFTLMGLSAYGLVVERRSQRARSAGRVYLVWTLAGELALFSGLLWLAMDAPSLRFEDLARSTTPDWAVGLLLVGFGVKLALPGLHFWLPGAYAAAPAAGAAVLSGPMIGAGLLGWLRFLPAEQPALVGWSTLWLALGAIGVLLGVVAGVLQSDPRRVLGYSSVSKMGLIAALFGLALAHPDAAAGITAALVLFALHHALVKAALFLGLGLWRDGGQRPWLLAGMTLLALSLAGAPLTGGATAKAILGAESAGLVPGLQALFQVSAIGTVLLMSRMLWLMRRGKERERLSFRAALFWLLMVPPALWLPYSLSRIPLDGSGLPELLFGLIIAAAFAWRGAGVQNWVMHRTSFNGWRYHRPAGWCNRRWPSPPALPWRGYAPTLPALTASQVGVLLLGLATLLFLSLVLAG